MGSWLNEMMEGERGEGGEEADGSVLLYLLDTVQPAERNGSALLLLGLLQDVQEDELAAVAEASPKENSSAAVDTDAALLRTQLGHLRELVGDAGWADWASQLPPPRQAGGGKDVASLVQYILSDTPPCSASAPPSPGARRSHFPRHVYAVLSQRIDNAIATAMVA